MIFGGRLLKRLDAMLDDALAGKFDAQSYDESLLSKIESKMARFLDASRLRREQVEAEQARVRALISDISHQTKTPLANITLYSQLLSEQSLNDEQAGLAGQIAASAEKLNFLVQSLVKTSRLESGIIKVAPQNDNVGELINAAVSECGKFAGEKNITLTATCGGDITAKFEPRWCGEALVNIIDNAVKYTPNGGRVTVTAAEYELFARIDVTDTGRGIREEDLPKVFTRFWRAAESADSHGVGIGLYLAREIINACGGYIKAASEIGKGSTFSVFLSKV
ncbi:two-component sensor histidine kinase [Clostridia bacterium]|nr:two-component sensor histidine kinase [Clostridia bacterium]